MIDLHTFKDGDLLDGYRYTLKGGRFSSIVQDEKIVWYYKTPAHTKGLKSVDTNARADILRQASQAENGDLYIRMIMSDGMEYDILATVQNMRHPMFEKVRKHFSAKGFGSEFINEVNL